MQKSGNFKKFATYTLTLLVVLAATLTVARAAEVFFSPEGGARARLVQAIRQSRQSIDVAVYHITSIDLADALADAHTRGVRVRIITDREKLGEPVRAAQILRRSGISMRALGVPASSLMHNKFAVFDDRLVATGSYNWTNPAERVNYENLVLLNDPDTVGRFAREFNRLWQEAKE
ncbi:MAG TPA: phospholipase D-like domain-containing protein [Candidatus Baltobacteraceae bacterium]|nr:phospholipase D-like domain-containing protein [Candidatus Baltobacteraceae bacterium]